MPNSLGKTARALFLAARHLKYGDGDGEDGGDDDGDETTATAIATNTNVAFSPQSIHTSLALLAAGAIGLTLDELVQFLDELTAADLSNFSHFVADKVLADRSASGGPQVLFGRGIWVDAVCGPLKKAFEDVLAYSYNAKAQTVDFKNKVFVDFSNKKKLLLISLFFNRHTADLRGMFEVDDPSAREPFVSSFVHRAVVEVNEERIDRAAAWSTRAGRGHPVPAVPIEFVADHPFMFFIMEDLSGVVVFIGLVLNPAL